MDFKKQLEKNKEKRVKTEETMRTLAEELNSLKESVRTEVDTLATIRDARLKEVIETYNTQIVDLKGLLDSY